jgi:outer membrane protein OmpA-like peptidoglycan-associated protein
MKFTYAFVAILFCATLQAQVEYLISKGVSANRLIAVGYGETQLLNDCNDSKPCSDSKHAENRRTEFKVY